MDSIKQGIDDTLDLLFNDAQKLVGGSEELTTIVGNINTLIEARNKIQDDEYFERLEAEANKKAEAERQEKIRWWALGLAEKVIPIGVAALVTMSLGKAYCYSAVHGVEPKNVSNFISTWFRNLIG